MVLSELEKQRLKNIERNKKALQEFQLREASNLAFEEGKSNKGSQNNATLGVSSSKSKRKANVDPPPRRIRNLRKHGINEEDRKKYLDTPVSDSAKPDKQAENTRKEGELKAKDLIQNQQFDQALAVMQQFREISAGDLFDSDAPVKNKDIGELRSKMLDLVADERNIKIIPERITTMCFHPSESKTIVFAGDKVGNVSLWDASMEEDKGLISFNFHSRNITNIVFDRNESQKVFTSSHDQSIRVLDLEHQKSSEICVLDGDESNGITDCHISGNTMYYSTLSGLLGRQDLREKPSIKHKTLTLSAKKIGGFSINPANDFQIATASLDRTMKIWDLRNPPAADYDYDYSALITGVYNSRLSISSTSWNNANQIVCNGYDNTINIFDVDNLLDTPIVKTELSLEPKVEKDSEPSIEEIQPEASYVSLEPKVRLQHNCQTGRWVTILKSRWQEMPKDGINKFIIGNMSRFADAFVGNGEQVAHLSTDQMTAVPAACSFHRSENWVVGGNSSGKVYLWTNEKLTDTQ